MKILLFCKDNESNQKALDITVQHAKAFNASVCLVSCIDKEPHVPTDITEEITEQAAIKMQEHVDTVFAPAGIDCTFDVIETTAFCGEAVVKYAEKNRVDVIIMSIKRRSRVGKMLFGSSSQHIILEAPCAVLTIT